jgi:uncharacterized alpha-E superfamily protein
VVTATGLQARRMVLRTFSVAQGGRYVLLAGGLARVAGTASRRVVSGAAGALAKDVWVLSAEPAALPGARPDAEPGARDVGALLLLSPGQEAQPALPPRVAENLYWLGRYAERAEDTARLLRVVDDLAEDYSTPGGSPGARSLEVVLRALAEVTATGPTPAADGQATPRPHRAELISLVVDAEREGSLAHAVRRAGGAAHAVREQLSMDTWAVLGTLERTLAELTERVATGSGDVPLQPALARVLEGLLALAGLGAESMVRDTGWHVMDAGRRLERCLQVLNLLRHTVVRPRSAGVEQLVLESVLIAAESVITYRRRTPGRAEVRGVLELLLLDRANPRAVAYQLDRLAEDLARLPGAGGGSTVLLRRATAALRETDLDAERLEEALAELVDVLSRLSEALEAEHFAHGAPLRPFGTPGARQAWGTS